MSKASIKAVVFDVRGVIVDHKNDIDILDGIRELLSILRQNGIRLAIVSSFSTENVKEMIGDLIIFFGDYIYNGSGIGKLNKIIEFAQKINIDPSEIAFIDDKPNNLKPVSRNSKVFTIGFKGSGKYSEIEESCKQLHIEFAQNPYDLTNILLNKIGKFD